MRLLSIACEYATFVRTKVAYSQAGEKKNSPAHKQAAMTDVSTTVKQQVSTTMNQSTSQSTSFDGVSSLFSILSSGADNNFDATLNDELQQLKPKKRNKKIIAYCAKSYYPRNSGYCPLMAS